jgi:predicted nucleic acid-binding protein
VEALMGVVLDSSFVVDLIQERPESIRKLKALADAGEATYVPSPVLFEVMTGILFTKSRTEAERFRTVAQDSATLPLDDRGAARAAEVMAELLRLGKRRGDADVMIAGIALAEGHRLLTRDKDFEAISHALGLVLEAY